MNYRPFHYSVLLQHAVINLTINFKQKKLHWKYLLPGFIHLIELQFDFKLNT